MSAVFRSKVDGKLKWLALALPCVVLLALLTAPPGNKGLPLLPLAMVLLVAVIVCWVIFATYYELQREQLVAHCGPFSWRIPLAEITEVRASNSLRSGPALSLDRLEIVYGGGKVLIVSPADKAGFVAALQRRAVLSNSAPAGSIPGP